MLDSADAHAVWRYGWQQQPCFQSAQMTGGKPGCCLLRQGPYSAASRTLPQHNTYETAFSGARELPSHVLAAAQAALMCCGRQGCLPSYSLPLCAACGTVAAQPSAGPGSCDRWASRDPGHHAGPPCGPGCLPKGWASWECEGPSPCCGCGWEMLQGSWLLPCGPDEPVERE